MFTPQRKGWSLAPRTTAERKKSPLRASGGPRGGSGRGKGPAEAGASLPPPPKDLLGENALGDVEGADGEAETWRRLKEAGMLDEAEMERKDREALLEKIGLLGSELYDYQYNMGLLLMEKKDWSAKFEDLNQRLLEADEMLKREKAANLVAMSEIEKREENLKKALDVEKQCVQDLEKALREMRAGQAEVKLTSDQKLADAHALLANLEEKSLEVQVKMRSADAKAAEISRKSAELERKSQELSSRERVIQREYASSKAEKESLLENIARQRDELRAWEDQMQDGHNRLLENQNVLNKREKKVNENEKNLLKKEKELGTMRESLEKRDKSLKEKEVDINVRLTALTAKEKEIEVSEKQLEQKAKHLLDREKELATREEVGMKKLLDEHNSSLVSKRDELELEMETKKKLLEGEHKDKLKSLEKREKEISKKEEQLGKREQALDKKAEKLKDDQQKLTLLSKDLKVREDSNKALEVELEKKANQLSEESQHLQASIAKNDASKKAIESEKTFLAAEKENLRIMEQERAEFVKLQSKLKQEIEDSRVLKESLIREREELKQEKENFEREWEALDDKRAALVVMEKKIGEKKAKLEKWKLNEEERFRIEQEETRNKIQIEMEELQLKKEAFEENMKHEKSQILDHLQQEREDILRKFENKKHQLEIDMQRKLEDSENQLEVERAKFNDFKEDEMRKIDSLRESIALETQKIKFEQDKLEREKQECLLQKSKLKEAENEVRNDIETLRSLSANLKIQREELVKEREGFLAIAEKYKSCQNSGVTIGEFVAPLLKRVNEIEEPESAALPSLMNTYILDQLNTGKSNQSPTDQSQSAGGKLSWLRNCTKIFKFSPGKRVEEQPSNGPNAIQITFGDQLDEAAFADASNSPMLAACSQSDIIGQAESLERSHNDPEPSHAKEDDSLGILTAEPVISVKEVEIQIAVHSEDRQDEMNSSLPPLPEKISTPKDPKAKVQRRGRGKGLKRTSSVQAVVEESKSFLNEPLDEDKDVEVHNLPMVDGASQGNLNDVDKRSTGLGHKRQRAQISVPTASEADGSTDAHSGSVSLGGRRKRRQTVAPETAAGGKRYNLRKSSISGSQTSVAKAETKPRSPVTVKSRHVIEEKKDVTPSHSHLVPLVDGSDKEMLILQSESIEVHAKGQVEAHSELNRNAEAAASSTPEDDSSLAGGSEDGSGEESESEKHNVSLGKKVWNFFTS